MIRIITVGKKHDAIFRKAIEHYEDRLRHYTKLEWTIIPHSTKEEESTKILSAVQKTDFVILFDESGKNFTSHALSALIANAKLTARNVACIIGGSYGVNTGVSERADAVLSFGTSVFPHQLVRLMVSEQMYRALSIEAGSGYHHD